MAARSPLKAVLDIRREELPFALLMFAYFFLVTGSFWLLKPIKKALFLEMYDPGGFQLLGLTLTGAQAEQLAYPNGDTPRVISRGDGSIPEGAEPPGQCSARIVAERRSYRQSFKAPTPDSRSPSRNHWNSPPAAAFMQPKRSGAS